MICDMANNSSLSITRRTFHYFAAVLTLLFYLLIPGGLFARPPDAAERATHFIENVCLDNLLTKAEMREFIHLPPPSGPPPLVLGCLLPGCELASSGPLELRIELYGDAVESATLNIDGVPPETMRALDFKGESVAALKESGRFKIGKGATRISGFPLSNIQIPISATKLSEVLREQTSPLLSIHTAQLQLTLDQAAMHRLASQAHETSARPGTEFGIIDLSAQVWGKNTLINQVTSHYRIRVCSTDGSVKGDDPIDQIHLTEQQGATVQNFPDDAVALANGRTSTGWVQPDAFRSKSLFDMPKNMLHDDKTCVQKNSADQDEPCTAEASIFTKNHGMTMALSPNWTFWLGDKVPASIKPTPPDLITVPIDFFILWEHGPLPPGTTCPTASPSVVAPNSECLLENWLTEANMIYENMFSGIRFTKRSITTTLTNDYDLLRAGCGDLDPIYSHFPVPNYQNPTAVRMFFVRHSYDRDSNQPGSGWTCTTTPYSTYKIDPTYYNEVFISVSHANATTLTHELGHILSLLDANNIDGGVPHSPHDWACLVPSITRPNVYCLNENNLMWSGSSHRSSLTKGQSFRTNVNEKSAVFRHDILGKVLDLLPRQCEDTIDNINCPSLTLDRP